MAAIMFEWHFSKCCIWHRANVMQWRFTIFIWQENMVQVFRWYANIVLMLFFKLALTYLRKITHFLTVLYCWVFRNLPLRNMHNPKIFFSRFLVSRILSIYMLWAKAQSKRYISYEHITTYYDFVLYTVYIQNQVYLFIFKAS